jgi:hypothetical protein
MPTVLFFSTWLEYGNSHFRCDNECSLYSSEGLLLIFTHFMNMWNYTDIIRTSVLI